MLIDRHSCGGRSNLVSAVTLLPAEQRRIESSTIRAFCGQEGDRCVGSVRPSPRAHSAPHERARPSESRPANPLIGAISSIAYAATRRRYLLESRERPVVSRRRGVGMPQCLSAPSRLLLERSAPQYRPPHRVVRYMLNRRNLRKVGPAPTFGPLRSLETAPRSQGFGLAVAGP